MLDTFAGVLPSSERVLPSLLMLAFDPKEVSLDTSFGFDYLSVIYLVSHYSPQGEFFAII